VPTEKPKPRIRKPVKRVRKPPKKRTPPPNKAAKPNEETTDTPVFGFSMESTTAAGAGPSMPVGNTVMADPAETKKVKPKKVKALAPPVPVYEVTEMPKIAGKCRGDYTEEARGKRIEGTVVLELVVGSNGRTRSIKVIKGLGHGLDEQAIKALKRCRFKPGTRNGKPVAVRLRSFKIRFLLEDD